MLTSERERRRESWRVFVCPRRPLDLRCEGRRVAERGARGGGGGAATLNEIDFLMKVCFLFAFQYEFEDQFCLNACVL